MFRIESNFFDIFNRASIGIVLCKNINNTVADTHKYELFLRRSEAAARKHLTNDVFSENDLVKEWREAYRKFRTKKGARSSIEALLNRVSKGNAINSINPLVDIYNSISLTYGLPCGGEDIDTFVGDLRLTKALGHEEFVTLGTEESEPPLEGEIVYKDDAGAVCRCWNWRECVRTMLTEQTKNAFVCLEILDDRRMASLHRAMEELAGLVREHLSGDCSLHILDARSRELEIA